MGVVREHLVGTVELREPRLAEPAGRGLVRVMAHVVREPVTVMANLQRNHAAMVMVKDTVRGTDKHAGTARDMVTAANPAIVTRASLIVKGTNLKGMTVTRMASMVRMNTVKLARVAVNTVRLTRWLASFVTFLASPVHRPTMGNTASTGIMATLGEANMESMDIPVTTIVHLR